MAWSWSTPEATPVLYGERVILRQPRSRDYAEWRTLRLESKAFLRPYEPRWTEADLARSIFVERIRRNGREAAEGTDFTFFIFITDGRIETLVGGITLSNIRRRAAQWGTLGYWMGEAYAGKGLMTEAVGVLLPFIFDRLGLHRIHAAFLPDNIASRTVLEKNGFREEGYAEAYLQIDGRWADHVLVALTHERYLARRGLR